MSLSISTSATPSSSRAILSADGRQALIVALSARSLALAAVRAGYCAIVVDLFGDVDTRRLAAASATVPGDLDGGFDAAALIETAQRLAPAARMSGGLVYGSGLESRPELVKELARGRSLWGNSSQVLRAVKEPASFFGLLDRLGLPHPEIRTEAPGDLSNWLVKGIGGAGGGHVRFLEHNAVMVEGPHYFQRRVAGRPVSGLFLANGRTAVMLGWSEQWPAPAPSHPFRFGGAVQPALLPEGVTRPILAALGRLAGELGLVGLNSLDLMVEEGGAFNLLEVNPRPGASLDVFDGEGGGALFGRHVEACWGRLTPGWRSPGHATAMSVVYADRALEVPHDTPWPDWLADRPAPGARIEPGAPVCTVMAEGEDSVAARRLVLSRNGRVLDALAAGQGEMLAERMR
jgi:uncharacterized protein